jgi:ankyrin repeat protein
MNNKRVQLFFLCLLCISTPHILAMHNDRQSAQSTLPEELKMHILSFLGPRDLCQSARVCKEWNRLTHDQYFNWCHVYLKNSKNNLHKAFICAVKDNNIIAQCYLLTHGADINYQEGSQNTTAFMHAITRGYQETLQFLIRQPRVNIDCVNKDGQTALMIAVHTHASLECIKLLLDNHAGVNFFGSRDPSLLIMAATQQGRTDLVKLLVAYKADVNYENLLGGTALVSAACDGDYNMVRFLLEETDAQVNYQTKDGYTALMWAAVNNHRNVVGGLLGCGANVNCVNKHGETALTICTPEMRQFIRSYIRQ